MSHIDPTHIDPTGARNINDRRLRRRILHVLFLRRGQDDGLVRARWLMDYLEAESTGGQAFEDDTHFLSLCRDLVAKELAVEIRCERKKWVAFSPDCASYQITAKGTSLWLESIPADPDIEDERA